MIDLVDFGGAFISLSSIHAIVTEPDEPGVVYVDYGHGNRIGFEGDVSNAMAVIAAWQRDNAPRAVGQPLLASA